jgi:nitrile hydratase
VIEDTRKERGDYDDFFRIAKPPHSGTLGERIARLEGDLREYQRLLQVLMRTLLDKGVLTTEQVERQRAFLAGRGAWNVARIVARAWVNAAFKQALLTRGREASAGAEHSARPASASSAWRRTRRRCITLWCAHSAHATRMTCWAIHRGGYRDDSYKERIVRDPRGMLADRFDLRLPDSVEVRVPDSTSDVRWMCCRVGPWAPTAGARRSWRDW